MGLCLYILFYFRWLPYRHQRSLGQMAPGSCCRVDVIGGTAINQSVRQVINFISKTLWVYS